MQSPRGRCEFYGRPARRPPGSSLLRRFDFLSYAGTGRRRACCICDRASQTLQRHLPVPVELFLSPGSHRSWLLLLPVALSMTVVNRPCVPRFSCGAKYFLSFRVACLFVASSLAHALRLETRREARVET